MPLDYLVVGLNHRTAPLEVRERLSLTKADLPEALRTMERFGVPGVILSTCNRSEFYVLEPVDSTGSPPPDGTGEARIKEFLVEQFNVSLPEIERYLYAHSGRQCIIHLFRVASGLDSMILGEEQIIGQVREAYDAGLKAGTIPGTPVKAVPAGAERRTQSTAGDGHQPQLPIGQPGLRGAGQGD